MLARGAALFLLISGVVYVGVSYYRLRNNQRFHMKSGVPSLSKEVTATINGYEQRITKNDKLYLWLRAAKEITYSDGHHELEDANIQVFPAVGDKPDTITASRAIYSKEPGKDEGVIQLSGNVQIGTRDGLKVKTDNISYDQQTQTADTAAPITFERENLNGSATGATVDGKNKKLVMKNAVAITVNPAAAATVANPKAKPKELKGARAKPVTIHSAQALFDQNAKSVAFTGGATAEQDADIMSGDNLNIILNDKKQVQKVELRGNSYLRAMDPGHTGEVHAVDMDFVFDGDQRLQSAIATRDVRAQTLGADSEMQLTGANSVETFFQAVGDRSVMKEMHAGGRSVVTLAAPKSKANDPRAASKRLTADAIKLFWRTTGTGRDLERAEAVGNAELFVDPVQKTAKADRETLTAARFDCDFYDSGNLARNAVATGGAKAVLDPVMPAENRSVRTITSQKMTAVFVRETQNPERLDAQGDVKFNERDRNGAAANASYTAADETVRLRGDPVVWDSRARTKANEIDSDTANHISYCRGKVQTTYYNQEQTNGATPFQRVKSPVYIVADRSEFNDNTGVGVFSGNARAWQDDNFVRSDMLTLFRDQKRMEGRGHVQSALYQAKRKAENGSTAIVPVVAAADFMRYSDAERLLHYETNVDIRQGTDRITAGVADVYLNKDGNEVERTIAQQNVVLTQPSKRGTGDWLQYTAADEVAVLKGNPAHVEDAEQGSSEGNHITVYVRENRAVVEDNRGEQSPGRVRSTHKVTKTIKP